MKNISELMLGKITRQQFLKMNNIDEQMLMSIIYNMLTCSLDSKSKNDVDVAIYLFYAFEINNEKFVPVLNELLVCSWHEQHENIAMALQKFRSPSSVNNLFQTINTKYQYLDYDDSYALAVKCIWALGDIGNELAKGKLEELLYSPNKIISENAMKQLKRFGI